MSGTKKTGPSDGSYRNMYDEDEENENENENKEKEDDERFRKEAEELEKIGKEMEERKKEKLKQFKKREIEASKKVRKEEEEIVIGGQKVKPKKIYAHKRGKGIFIRGESKNYQRKINKILKRKVHGVSLAKKKEIGEIIKNCAMRETSIKEKEIDNIFSKLKYKRYTGSGSVGIKKMFKDKEEEGVNIKKYKKELKRKFTRRELNKFRRAIKGEENPLKYKMESTSNRILNKTGNPGSSSPASKIGKRF